MTQLAPTNEETVGLVTRGELNTAVADVIKKLQDGRIPLPVINPAQTIFAGATNHAPNSNNSFSTAAATIPGTLPTDPGDENQEDYRYYRQKQGDNLTLDAAHAVKAVDHSLYAADEGVNTEVPIWDRINGWIVMGGEEGKDQYDIALYLFGRPVEGSQRWFVLARIVSLTDDILDPDLEVYFGIWQIGSTEGWIQGDPFDITYSIHGTKGTKHLRYRVVAKTDSGVSVLSNILDVPDAPDDLNTVDYPVLFFNAGPGFFWFDIYREDVDAGTFAQVFTIRNSTDLFYNDVGNVGVPKPGWPTVPDDTPLAYAKTRNVRVGAFGGTWALVKLTIDVPNGYNYSESTQQFLRYGITTPSTVDRQIGIDQIMFSTQYGAYSPDVLQAFSDGTRPVESVSPTSGSQGGNGGLDPPSRGGSGDPLCIVDKMPVMVLECSSTRHPNTNALTWGMKMKPFRYVRPDEHGIKGEHRTCYRVLRKRVGTASQYYRLKTKNGITYECNGRHVLIRDVATRSTIQAQQVVAGETKIEGRTLKGRRFKTVIISKELIPTPVDVGTFTLRHPEGLSEDGHGMYCAGWSLGNDMGLFSLNAKPIGENNPE